MTQTPDLSIAQHQADKPNPPVFDTRVDPESLAELFARDPEKLSDQDIDTIVTELRSKRGLFEQQEQAKSMKEKKPRGKEAPKQPKLGPDQLSLADLDL